MSEIFYERLTDACHSLLSHSKSIHSYLLDRGIKQETINAYKLGAFPRDLRDLFYYINAEELRRHNIIYQADKSPFRHFPVVIPINDVLNHPVAIGCRTLLNDNERDNLGIPKYRNSNYSKTSHLFGLNKAHDAIRTNNKVFVVEGYFDVLSAHQNGIVNVVATCGTLFSLRQLALLARYTNNVCLFFDNDGPGRLNSKRVMDKFKDLPHELNLTCNFTPDGFKDLDEFLVKGGNFEFIQGV